MGPAVNEQSSKDRGHSVSQAGSLLQCLCSCINIFTVKDLQHTHCRIFAVKGHTDVKLFLRHAEEQICHASVPL